MYFGIGLYTPGDVAALLHERPDTVRRWAFGGGRQRASEEPLIRTELPVLQGQRALTFVELIELLYIRTLERGGVPRARIREAAAEAAERFATAHPFALRPLYAEPERVCAALRAPDGPADAGALVRPYLAQIEFGGDGVARRWWPMGRDGGVVLDPDRGFGAPTLEGTRIHADLMARTYDAELPAYGDRTLDHVAWTYEIHPGRVKSALEFREWLRKAA